MQIGRARPLAVACLASMAIAVTNFLLPGTIRLACSVLLFIIFLMLEAVHLIFRRRSNSPKDYPVIFILRLTVGLMLVISMSSTLYFGEMDQAEDRFVDSEHLSTVECVIIEEQNAGAGYTNYMVTVKAINGEPVNLRAALECAYTAPFHIGDRVELQVNIYSHSDFYDRDDILYAIADGISFGMVSEDMMAVCIIGSRSMPIRTAFSHWRENLAIRLENILGKKHGNLATALFLGDRTGVDARITTAFRRTGTAHLLALSGMHVTLIMGLAATLTVFIPKRGRLVLLSVLAVAYLALIGFAISAVRAIGMLLLFYLADLVGRRHDPLTTLSLTGFLMLACSPTTVADGGFWMSFAAVFGLVTVYPKFNEWLQSKQISSHIKHLMLVLAASFIAVVAVSFLNWLFCGEIALIGIVLTAILSPMLMLALILILIALVLDVLPFLSATPIAWLLSSILELMVDITDLSACLPFASITLVMPFVGPLLAIMTCVLVAMLFLPIKHRILLMIPPLLAVVLFIGCYSQWESQMYDKNICLSYVSRSSGSALVISDREGTAVIDTSSGNFSIMRDVERSVREHGATEIEHLILTHYHRAYSYSTERLAERMIVRQIWMPIPETEEEYFHLSAMHARLEPLGVKLRCYQTKAPINLFGSASFLLANIEYLDRSTQPIITYLLQTPNETLTYTTPSIQESDYIPMFRWIFERTDKLILSEHGPNIKQILELPLDMYCPELLITDSIDVLAWLDLSPTSRVYQLPHITDITTYRFTIKK